MERIDLGRDLGLTFNRRKPKEWTQDYVEETKIIKGVVIREDQRGRKHYTKIFEISAVNFMIMSQDEQERLIYSYIRLLRTGPANFHIKIVTTRTNIEEYVAAAIEACRNEQNESCRQEITHYINYLTREASNQTFRKHYYYIFEYEPPQYGKPANTEEEVIAAVNKKAREVKDAFNSIGSKVVLKEAADEDVSLAELLYNSYNRRICRTEPFKSRVRRITDDIRRINKMEEYDELPDVDFKTILAPKSIDFNESPTYMVIGGLYKSHFYIPGYSIPHYVTTDAGWLTELANLGEGFDIDLYFYKGDSAQKLESIANQLKFKRSDLDSTDAEDMNADEVMGKYNDTMFMKSALGAGGEEIYDMCVLISTYAHTLQELAERRDFIRRRGIELGISIRECIRFQEDAFFSTGFNVHITPKMFNLARRNITTSGVAATFPFTAFVLRDTDGIALGYNRNNMSLIMMDLFAPHYSNANLCIYGASGRGKTYALMIFTSRMRFQNIQQFILAPDKQHEFIKPCIAFGGEFIDISPSSSQRINLFDIRPKVNPELSLLGTSYVEKSWLIEKVDAIKIFCSYLIRDLSIAEKVIIENIALDMYREFGISEDNDSIFADESRKTLKEMPVMSDFYERVKASGELRPDIATILSQFVVGAARSMNGHTNVDLDNKYIVFGLENIKGDLLAPSMFIILDYVWGKCREDRTKKKMISIDEGWKLLDNRNPLVGEFVQEIFKVIRGYGGGALFATQSIVDLFRDGSNFGNAILSCSHSKVILGMEQKDLSLLKEELGLSPTEASSIIGAGEGEALLCAGFNHIPIKISASEEEHRLFTTKRSELEKMLAEQMSAEKRV